MNTWKFRAHAPSLITYVGFTALALFTLPSPLVPTMAGLDPSCAVGLNLAVANGFVFGKDILYTYGPLGYLFNPTFVNRYLWMSAVIFNDVIHVAFFLSLAAFALHSKSGPLSVAALWGSSPIVRYLIGIPYTLGALLLITSYLAVSNDKNRRYLPLLAIIAALTFYLKVDIGLLSFAVILLATTWIFFKHRRWRSLVPLATYAASFIATGILLTRSLEVFASFLFGSMQIATGHGNAMSIDAMPSWFILFPLISSLCLLTLAITKSRDNKTLLFALSLPFLFITFIYGFVREDLHILTFFGGWSLFCLLLQSAVKFTGRRVGRRVAKPLAFFLALTLLVSGFDVYNASGFAYHASGLAASGQQPPQPIVSASRQVLDFVDRRLLNLLQTVDLIAHPQKAETIFSSSVAALRQAYPLSNETLTMLRGHTVDVIPWDVSLAYAYGLRWDPAPIFQAFVAYTTYLDDVNAHHYESRDSPDFVLYSVQSIDGRYPPFDEPHAFRALIYNYDLVGKDGQFFILKKKTDRIYSNPVLISAQETTFGQPLEVPVNHQEAIITRVFIEPNWIGKGMSLLYKIPRITINLEFSNGTTQNYRFIASTGSNGLLLRGRALENMFQLASVDRLTFYTDGPQFYNPVIRIEFYAVHVSSLPISGHGSSPQATKMQSNENVGSYLCRFCSCEELNVSRICRNSFSIICAIWLKQIRKPLDYIYHQMLA